MAPLSGKLALVTGSETGIGRAITLALARDGADLVLHYLEDSAAVEQVASEVRAAGVKATVAAADLADPAQVAALFEPIDRLDILVNNAGTGVRAEVGEITADAVDTVFAVNVRGTALCASLASHRMGDGGRIINISSSTTVYPQPGMSIYTASKAAIRAFTEVWAKELGSRGINVNSVLPGPTSPGMTDRAPAEVKTAMAALSPYGRIGHADEIADVVAFLCGPGARWISGQHLLVNGAASA